MNIKLIFTMFFIIIITATTSFGDTVILRNGTKISGELISKDDDKIVLKTASGVKSVKWCEMTTASFKKNNPEFYKKKVEEYKQKKEAKATEMEAKGYVKLGKKWIKKEEAESRKYEPIRAKINVVEKKDSFKIYSKDRRSSSRCSKRAARLLAAIDLKELNENETYELKISIKNILKYVDSSINSKNEKNTKKQELDETFSISNTKTFSKEVQTEDYEMEKHERRQRKDFKYGYESDAFEVKVYLDGKLIYEDAKGASPVYHLVTKI